MSQKRKLIEKESPTKHEFIHWEKKKKKKTGTNRLEERNEKQRERH